MSDAHLYSKKAPAQEIVDRLREAEAFKEKYVRFYPVFISVGEDGKQYFSSRKAAEIYCGSSIVVQPIYAIEVCGEVFPLLSNDLIPVDTHSDVKRFEMVKEWVDGLNSRDKDSIRFAVKHNMLD